jgi:uncharacterized membrane protein YqiK
MFFYKVAEPNEALIISGYRAHHGPEGDAAGLGFKIVVGKGAWVTPGLQKVRRLSLDIHEAELDLECVTTQGIRVGVKAVVIYKIADDYQSIANAARRFLEQEEQMDVKVHNVFAGHLRSIIGTMTVEDLIRNRDNLTRATRESSASEMERLGLTIDSLQIQEIVDNSGYIDNLSMPEAARVAMEARIAQAAADREATEREQEADALKVAARSTSEIKQAQVTAEAQKAQAEAEQAGPLDRGDRAAGGRGPGDARCGTRGRADRAETPGRSTQACRRRGVQDAHDRGSGARRTNLAGRGAGPRDGTRRGG